MTRGVRIEALSIENDGDGISCDVYILNMQDGIAIDHATGDSWIEGAEGADVPIAAGGDVTCALNTNTKRLHLSGCSSARSIKEGNREDSKLGREEIIKLRYMPCGVCGS